MRCSEAICERIVRKFGTKFARSFTTCSTTSTKFSCSKNRTRCRRTSPGPGESVSNTRGPRVSFLVVPADRAGPSEETGFWQYLIALALIGFTVGSAVQLGLVAEVSRLPEETMRWLAEGGGAAGIDPSIDPSAPPPGLENFDTVAYVEAALPVTAGVLLSSLAHEVGHRVVGAMRNVKLSIPYLIPNGQLGTFGTITQIKSIPENRSDFFDVAIAGPLLWWCHRFGVIFVRFSFIHWPRPGVCADTRELVREFLVIRWRERTFIDDG